MSDLALIVIALLIAAASFLAGCLTTEVWFLSHGYRRRAHGGDDPANIVPLRPSASPRGNSSSE